MRRGLWPRRCANDFYQHNLRRSKSRIVDFTNPDVPNPDYYRLATSLGHHYWLLNTSAVGTASGACRDTEVPIDEFGQLIEQVLKDFDENGGNVSRFVH